MQEILVSQEESGQRLDKFLRRRLPLAPSSFIYKMLRKKNITLRGKKADGSEKVETGDSIKLFLADDTILKFSRPAGDGDEKREEDENLAAYKKLDPLLGPSPVLYEDDNILVVRKPSGILSQKADASDLSMNEWLRGYLAQNKDSMDRGEKRSRISSEKVTGKRTGETALVFRPSVCNRLDRNTGGILLCAKTLRGSRALSAVIRDRAVRKTYTMVVHGQICAPGTIDNELIKDRQSNLVRLAERESGKSGDGKKSGGPNVRNGETRFGRGKNREKSGQNEQELQRRQAVTVYRPVLTGNKASMVEADLITGRSHQLRVHMASIGHPIVSDPKYGDRNLDSALLRALQKSSSPQPKQPAQKSSRKAGPVQRGQLLWCSEVSFPDSFPDPADADGAEEVLAPVAGRVFKCPPPRWWEELCK